MKLCCWCLDYNQTYRFFGVVAHCVWPLRCDKNVYGWSVGCLGFQGSYVIKSEGGSTCCMTGSLPSTQVHYLKTTATWIYPIWTCGVKTPKIFEIQLLFGVQCTLNKFFLCDLGCSQIKRNLINVYS